MLVSKQVILMIYSQSKSFPIWFFVLVSLSLFCFCTKVDEKNQLAQQLKNIDNFITRDTSNAKGQNRDTIITVTNKRETSRIVWNPGDSDTLAVGDTVAFAYIGRLFTAGKGNIFSTNLPEVISSGAWPTSIFPEDYGKNAVGVGYYLPGLDAGLLGMRAGEYAYIIFTSQYGYGNKELSTIPKMSSLMFEVEIKYIIKKR